MSEWNIFKYKHNSFWLTMARVGLLLKPEGWSSDGAGRRRGMVIQDNIGQDSRFYHHVQIQVYY